MYTRESRLVLLVLGMQCKTLFGLGWSIYPSSSIMFGPNCDMGVFDRLISI